MKPNATLEKHFLTQRWKTKEVSEGPCGLPPPVCLHGCREGGACGRGVGGWAEKAQAASGSSTVPPPPPQTPSPDSIFTPTSVNPAA